MYEYEECTKRPDNVSQAPPWCLSHQQSQPFLQPLKPFAHQPTTTPGVIPGTKRRPYTAHQGPARTNRYSLSASPSAYAYAYAYAFLFPASPPISTLHVRKLAWALSYFDMPCVVMPCACPCRGGYTISLTCSLAHSLTHQYMALVFLAHKAKPKPEAKPRCEPEPEA